MRAKCRLAGLTMQMLLGLHNPVARAARALAGAIEGVIEGARQARQRLASHACLALRPIGASRAAWGQTKSGKVMLLVDACCLSTNQVLTKVCTKNSCSDDSLPGSGPDNVWQ